LHKLQDLTKDQAGDSVIVSSIDKFIKVKSIPLRDERNFSFWLYIYIKGILKTCCVINSEIPNLNDIALHFDAEKINEYTNSESDFN